MGLPSSVTICSYRLGGTDGVSIEAEKWRRAMELLGCHVTTVAGEGRADILLPGLAASASVPPRQGELTDAFFGAEVVVVENLCSLPLNPAAGAAVASALAGRPAILRHHDLASQRPALAHLGPPPSWRGAVHVTINECSARELRSIGYDVTVVYNTFDPDPAPGRRAWARSLLEVGDDDIVLLQPTRAIPRKNIPGALALASSLGALYWLLGSAEDGYGPELERLLAATRQPRRRGVPARAPGFEMADAYAACDVVALPSTWEGFGNPAIEAATHDRPLAIGDFAVARELRNSFGFEWFDASDPRPLASYLANPDLELIARNHEIARRHFSSADLPRRIYALLTQAVTLDRP